MHLKRSSSGDLPPAKKQKTQESKPMVNLEHQDPSFLANPSQTNNTPSIMFLVLTPNAASALLTPQVYILHPRNRAIHADVVAFFTCETHRNIRQNCFDLFVEMGMDGTRRKILTRENLIYKHFRRLFQYQNISFGKKMTPTFEMVFGLLSSLEERSLEEKDGEDRVYRNFTVVYIR